MAKSYVGMVAESVRPDPAENVVVGIFKQYEDVLVQSIVTSFGLDFLLFKNADQHGGDVDTIHNARQIGQDAQMRYKNAENARAYAERGPYDSKAYHTDPRYKMVNAQMSAQKKAGALTDAYTGKPVARNADMDLDHVISAKEIHDDRGRVLSGLRGEDLANSPENLRPTDRSINRSMGAKSMEEYIAQLERDAPARSARIRELKSKGNLSDRERKELAKLEKLSEADPQTMRSEYERSRKSYEAKLQRAYYTSPQFVKDTAKAAGKVGVRMGLRQMFGFIFMEFWFSVKEEFRRQDGRQGLDLSDFFKKIANSIQKTAQKIRSKYKEIIAKFGEGMIGGMLGSLTTTVANIFFTTAKNVVRIIRQAWASLVEAVKILLLNPDNLLFGERIRAAAKILAVGASVIVGRLVEDVVSKTPVAAIPVVGPVVQTFCGTFVTGILSCTLLYFLDRSELVNRIVEKLNAIPSVEKAVMSFRRQAELVEQYAAELMQIDLGRLKQEADGYYALADQLAAAQDETQVNGILHSVYRKFGWDTPWQGDFDAFMQNRNNRLVFS